MRSFNIFFTTMMKGLEVIATFMLTANLAFWMSEYVELKREYSFKRSSICYENKELSVCNVEVDTYYSLAIFIILAFSLMHNNFLKNLRLALAKSVPFCCFVCWNPINILICKFDKCMNCRYFCTD